MNWRAIVIPKSVILKKSVAAVFKRSLPRCGDIVRRTSESSPAPTEGLCLFRIQVAEQVAEAELQIQGTGLWKVAAR
jgi:hypothetical protein